LNSTTSKLGLQREELSLRMAQHCVQRAIDLRPIMKDSKKVPDAKPVSKASLTKLSIAQLKSLADKHNISVKGKLVEDGWFETHRESPTREQYIAKLSGIVTAKELAFNTKEKAKPLKKKRKANSVDSIGRFFQIT
jgi:hypothetical protein